MTVTKFPSNAEVAYKKAVAEWRELMKDSPLPRENIEAAAEEMARYWLVLDQSPPRSFNLELSGNLSAEERQGFGEQVAGIAGDLMAPYEEIVNYAKGVIYPLVLQKHGAILNYEPGMGD